MSDEPTPEPQTFACPDCGEPIQAVPGPVAQLIDCPACEERFLIPSETGSTDLPTDSEPSDEDRSRQAESELNALHMRHIVVARRTAIRSRTYAILGAGACAMGAVKLCLMTWHEVRALGWGLRPVSFVIFALAACFGVTYFLGRAAHWQRESQAAKIPDPETPPDFTPLSDGSQHARNLENLHGPPS